MRPPPRPVSDHALREAARRAIERTSLRKVALAVGMSPTGLQNTLEASESWNHSTRRKLTDWYLRRQAAFGEVDAPTASAAIDALCDRMSSVERRAFVPELLRMVREVHLRAKREPPAWLGELADGAEPKE